jgi:hypothetical protein
LVTEDGLACNALGCGDLISISVLLPLLRLVAHASAKVEIKINAAAAILARQIDTCATLPARLFFPFEFI